MTARAKAVWETMSLSLLLICAIVTTGAVVWRYTHPTATEVAEKPVYIRDWDDLLKAGIRVGPVDARIKIVEFADFECPFCATFQENYLELQKKRPKDVSLHFIHYPLPGHRFAVPAAHAAECAHEQGRFAEMHSRLLKEQTSFGVKPWREFAIDSGVQDISRFDACLDQSAPPVRIAIGQTLAKQYAIRGTPAVVVNGWKLPNASKEQLERAVDKILSGKKPS